MNEHGDIWQEPTLFDQVDEPAPKRAVRVMGLTGRYVLMRNCQRSVLQPRFGRKYLYFVGPASTMGR